MPTVRLTETHIQGLYRGSDGEVYALIPGAEALCCRCGRWTQVVYKQGRGLVCDRHVRITDRTRIRLTTTFACRVYQERSEGLPPAKVLRRGDQIEVQGRPESRGRFDRFVLRDGRGFILVPRSRWAWV